MARYNTGTIAVTGNNKTWWAWNSIYAQSTTVSNIKIWDAWNRSFKWDTGTGGGVYFSNNSTTTEWVWLPTTNIKFEATWDEWNYHWAETEEVKRAREVSQYVDLARAVAYDGRRWPAYPDFDAVVAHALTGLDLTDDERRQLEDGWQRGREERIEADRQAEAARLREEERKLAQEAANRKAELLLISLLTHEQKEEWMAHRRVTEVAPSGRVWRLFPNWSGAATLMEGEVRRATLCIHPRERVPEADVIAAIITLLRSNEERHLIEIAVLHNGKWTPEEEEMRAHFRAETVYAPDQGAHIRVPAVA